LTKRNRKPVRAVVTGRGEVDLKHPVFNPKKDEWQPVIFTTKKGEEKLKSQAKRLQVQGFKPLQPAKTYAIGDTSVDLTKAVGILRKDYNTKLLDIQAGRFWLGVWSRRCWSMRSGLQFPRRSWETSTPRESEDPAFSPGSISD